ncbi:MAG: hypothetical protein NTU95_06200 [Methanothrix sp.]|nr:hypothetical protein [Methanothrix sp.]
MEDLDMSYKIVVVIVLLGLIGLMASESLAQESIKIRPFRADPSAICAGQGTILSWDVSGATKVTIEPDIHSVGLNGSIEVFPRNNTTYELTASNNDRDAVAKVKVVVKDCIAIEKFLVEPQKVCKGSNATLQWKVVGASNVTIDHGIGEVPPAGVREVTGNESTTYNLTAINSTYVFSWDEIPGKDNERLLEFLAGKFDIDWIKTATLEKIDIGKAIKIYAGNNSLTLKLNDIKNGVILEIQDGRTYKFIAKIETDKLNIYNSTKNSTANSTLAVDLSCPKIISFEVDHPNIIKSSKATLKWNVTNAENVSIDGIREENHTGSRVVTPNSTIVYTLNASNGTNFAISETLVNVRNKFPEIEDFTASPSSIVRGTGSMLSWNTTGADRVSINPDIGEVASCGSRRVTVERDTRYILMAGNASGEVTKIAPVNVTNIAYDFVARAPYAEWHAEIDGQEYRVKFPSPVTSTNGYARYFDDTHSILEIGPRRGGKIIGDFTGDMTNSGYFIDPRDTLNFSAELSDWTSLLTNVIITPMLGANSLGSYNIYAPSLDLRETKDQISLRDDAHRNRGIYLIVDCNGYDWGDNININEMKIVRESRDAKPIDLF